MTKKEQIMINMALLTAHNLVVAVQEVLEISSQAQGDLETSLETSFLPLVVAEEEPKSMKEAKTSMLQSQFLLRKLVLVVKKKFQFQELTSVQIVMEQEQRTERNLQLAQTVVEQVG